MGINVEGSGPRREAPYPPAYFPGTRDPQKAKKFVISGPARFADVDIVVPAASEVFKLKVKATLEDGRPLKDQLIGLSPGGYGVGSGERTDADGVVWLPVVRGERFYVMGYGMQTSGCPSPVEIGPRSYPEVVQMVYTTDGCREQFNLEHRRVFLATLKGKSTVQVPVIVSFPNGSSAYKAQVSLLSTRPESPSGGAFLTARDGHIDLPIPSGQEFLVDATYFAPEIQCGSQKVLLNSDSGIRWREAGPAHDSGTGWRDTSDKGGAIELTLRGASCKPTVPSALR